MDRPAIHDACKGPPTPGLLEKHINQSSCLHCVYTDSPIVAVNIGLSGSGLVVRALAKRQGVSLSLVVGMCEREEWKIARTKIEESGMEGRMDGWQERSKDICSMIKSLSGT